MTTFLGSKRSFLKHFFLFIIAVEISRTYLLYFISKEKMKYWKNLEFLATGLLKAYFE